MFTRKKKSAVILVLAVLLALPPVTFAQEATKAINDWAGLKMVAAGSKIDVKLKNEKRVKGKLISVSDTALSLFHRNKQLEINRDDILSIHEMRGMTAKKATLIGAGVGAAVGAGFGVSAADRTSDCFLCFNKQEGAAIFGIPGAGVGALIGFVFGKISHKRALIYQAKRL